MFNSHSHNYPIIRNRAMEEEEDNSEDDDSEWQPPPTLLNKKPRLPKNNAADDEKRSRGIFSCAVCSEKRISVVCVPCGHMQVCLGCLRDWQRSRPEKLLKCLICRKRVKKVYRVYLQ